MDENNLTEEMYEQLKEDSRKGVQRLVKLYEKRRLEKTKLREQFLKMCQFDEQFKLEPATLVAGVDEAGRGPLAGPVVAAAVILPNDFNEIYVNDSKQLTEQERERLYDVITQKAVSFSIAVIDNEEIDRLNILHATQKAMENALATLSIKPDIALIDAVKLQNVHCECREIIKGDEKSVAIAAASILAKVTRDKIMDDIAEQYPAYDFENNKGYGTKKHLDALEKFGPTVYHRRSFSPVQNVLFKKEGLL